jgi:hypothetical protein
MGSGGVTTMSHEVGSRHSEVNIRGIHRHTDILRAWARHKPSLGK